MIGAVIKFIKLILSNHSIGDNYHLAFAKADVSGVLPSRAPHA
jgi:hypothetical protein